MASKKSLKKAVKKSAAKVTVIQPTKPAKRPYKRQAADEVIAPVEEVVQYVAGIADEVVPAVVGSPDLHSAPSAAAVEVKQLEDRDEMARGLLGEKAVVWTATHDWKGNPFTSTLFRVGVYTDKPNSYRVEEGRLMIGAGRTFAEAFRDAKARSAEAAAVA